MAKIENPRIHPHIDSNPVHEKSIKTIHFVLAQTKNCLPAQVWCLHQPRYLSQWVPVTVRLGQCVFKNLPCLSSYHNCCPYDHQTLFILSSGPLASPLFCVSPYSCHHPARVLKKLKNVLASKYVLPQCSQNCVL